MKLLDNDLGGERGAREEKDSEKERDGEGRKERQVGKRESPAGKARKKRYTVATADARRRCNGNFQRLRVGEEVGSGKTAIRERESERTSERG